MDYIQKENRLIFHKLEVDLLQMLLIEWSSQIEQKNLLMLLMDYWTIPGTLTKITNIYTFISFGELNAISKCWVISDVYVCLLLYISSTCLL